MLPLFFGVVLLTLVARALAADLAIPYWDSHRINLIVVVVKMFLILMILVLPWFSLGKARSFVRAESGEIDLAALWRSISINPLVACLGVALAAYGMTSMGSLVEVYRVHAVVWHDPFLWSLEEPLIKALLSSPLNIPWFWDAIYMAFWVGLLVMASILQIGRRSRQFHGLLLAAVVAFFFTRLIAINWPSAGPMFFVPELFSLDGTGSAAAKEGLMRYMERGDPQTSGWIPGTMAMPSLHIGITGMAAWYLGREFKWSYWISLPWLALIWLSTVFLGWHYILDGVGGLAVAVISVLLASRFSKLVHRLMEVGLLYLPLRSVMPLFMRFLLAGGIATLAHFATLIVLVELAAVPVLGASLAGYLVGMVVGYLLNYHFAFRSHAPHQETAWRFLLVACMGFILNGLLMAGLLNLPGFGYVMAQVVASLMVLLWSFGANALWIFRCAKRTG